MRKTSLMVAAGVVAALGATAFATTSDAQDRGWRGGDARVMKAHRGGGRGFHGRGHGGGHAMRLFQTFDTDGDGRVTQQEIDAYRADQIERFDADNDGNLSLEEYQGLWLEAMRERMVDDFQRHDDDGDGQVTPDEFNERFAGLVERLDRNGDGALDREDRRWRGRNGPGDGPRRGPMMDDGEDEPRSDSEL